MSFLPATLKALERIAPLHLAESWDNVGLILEAYKPQVSRRILLTIDLNPLVVEEAVTQSATTIVSYHPPIFRPLSRVTLADPLQSSLLRCAADGISVYSPHSALDSVHSGINDWLASALLELKDNQAHVANVKELPGKEEIGGLGRIVLFGKPVALNELVSRIKSFLGLETVEVAVPKNRSEQIKSVAICAGAGGSMLKDTEADVYWTGEMPHHEVLAAVGRGHHVILCGHTNTERGYLPVLAKRLRKELLNDGHESEVICSKMDSHPLQTL